MVSYQLCDRKDGSEDFKAVQAGRDFVVAGVKEDGHVQASIQSGLKTPAIDVLTFGLFEGGIMRFHKHVAAALSELDQAATVLAPRRSRRVEQPVSGREQHRV